MFRVLFLVVNMLTGQPVDGGRYDDKTFSTYEECYTEDLSKIPIQHPKDGKIFLYACGLEKEVTIL